jgi:hypothetical protein
MKLGLEQLLRIGKYADLGNITSRLHLRFAAKYRPQRMRKMQAYFEITKDTTILDVGGSPVNAETWDYLEIQPKITILNIGPRPDVLPDRFEYIDEDARKMSFDTKSFDLCFSNSVIEHVGTWEDQQLVADEIRRVGRSYYVQTPNFDFFIEPHFIAPFIHWLPPGVRRRLVRYFSLWGLTTRPAQEEIDRLVSETVLLTKRQMKTLFPEANFLPEKVLGMQKSLIAVYKNEAPS